MVGLQLSTLGVRTAIEERCAPSRYDSYLIPQLRHADLLSRRPRFGGWRSGGRRSFRFSLKPRPLLVFRYLPFAPPIPLPMPARDSVAQQPTGTLSTATMSDEEEAVAEAEEIIRSQRIFLNHLDSYGGRNIGKVGAQGCIAQKREGRWSSASGHPLRGTPRTRQMHLHRSKVMGKSHSTEWMASSLPVDRAGKEGKHWGKSPLGFFLVMIYKLSLFQ